MDPVYLLLEVVAATFFVLASWLALRRGRLPFLELISAAMFGLLLEEGDQLIFETYSYADAWILSIDRAPIVIGLTWALIIAGAMRITDALGVRRRWAPFVDSLLAIMLDFAFDAIAIRMGLWTWRDVGSADGWFGVPAGNFYAWLFVTWAFTILSRWLRETSARRPSREWLQLLVPTPAFVLLLVSLVPFTVLQPLVDPAPGGGMILFLVTLITFVAAAAWGAFGPNRATPDGSAAAILDLRLAFGTRVAIHLFFVAAILVLDLAATEPILLAVALLLLAAELPLGMIVERRRRSDAAVSARDDPGAVPSRA
ncbi:MAG: carotenoid biosynthesis protein [Chloroflexi bacterium]|nr:carotenoid biosynthesis protein [Chloroflexota bacterium]